MAHLGKTLTEKWNSLGTSVPPEKLIAAFAFDLDPVVAGKRVDGFVGVSAESVTVFIDGRLEETIPFGDVKEFTLQMGAGTLTLEYVMADGKPQFLCRSDLKHLSTIGNATKALNRYIERGSDARGMGEVEEKCCPKCGRPYEKGSQVCNRCAGKLSMAKRLWDVAKPYKFSIFGSIILFFVVTGLGMLSPVINKIMVDDYITPHTMNNTFELFGFDVSVHFLLIVGSILLVQIIHRAISLLRSYLLIHAGNKVIVRLRELVFGKIQQMSVARISRRTAGELMQRVRRDTSAIQNFIVNDLANILEQMLLLVGISVFLLVYDWKLALLVLLPTPFVVVSFRFFWRFMHSLFRRHWQVGSDANAALHDIFSGIRVVKAFGTEKRESERFDKISRTERDTQIRQDKTWSLIMPFIGFFMGFGEFILLGYTGIDHITGGMSLGSIAMFSSYVGLIYGPLRQIAHIPRMLMRATTSVSKVFEIIDEEVDMKDAESPSEHRIEGHIDINNISFGYDESGEVLRSIDLHIKPGEFIGIVGKSGVGKSTLINLLMRMYDVDDGSIEIDGIDIRDYSQEALRSQIGVVLQETFLFSGSVYQNIAYAKPHATRDEIIDAAKLSGAHSFIIKLPDGYDTYIGERGYTLSGGERQRLSIARALLHDPRILILDEATASLDTETEKQIQDALQRLSKTRTTIAIAHRLSTLRNATKLVVLDRGRVAEIGTHEELVEKKGIYYGLVMAQRQMSKMADVDGDEV